MAEKYPAGLSESNEGLIEQPPMAKSKTKQFFLLLPWVISGLLAIYNAGPLVTSYLEWTPHLSVEFKPPPPDILNTSFCWKNEGKLFTLREIIHATECTR